jgi:hypothetical protein
VLSGQSEKVEEVGIAEDHVGRESVFVAESGDVFGDEDIGLPANGGPLVQQMPDFVPQRASAPSFNSAQLGVKLAFQRIVKVDQFFEMAPTQLPPQCRRQFPHQEKLQQIASCATSSSQKPRPYSSVNFSDSV